MSKRLSRILIFVVLLCVCSFNVFAAEEDVEQSTLVEGVPAVTEDDMDQYVDGLYNTSSLARTSIAGVVRLYQSGTKIGVVYSTTCSESAKKVGVKDVKLQYKGSLGLWHTAISIDDRYVENKSTYDGGFSCSGVTGRVYRLKVTHYATGTGFSKTKDNEAGNLTFQ
jgi:hypothetical protein